jgi:hypothetical protein
MARDNAQDHAAPNALEAAMSRILYAWRDGGKFYLSAFKAPRAHDGKRPANEYGTETELLDDVKQREAEVIWEGDDAKAV